MAKRNKNELKPINREVSDMYLKLQKMKGAVEKYEALLRIKAAEMHAKGETADTFDYAAEREIPDRDKISELWLEAMTDIPFPETEPTTSPDWKRAMVMLEEDGLKVPTKPTQAQLRKRRKKEAN